MTDTSAIAREETRAPAVSVVTPVFNGERFIAAAIESVLGQTLDDFEMVIVDDGSTDRTAEIVRAFDDPRIILAQPGRLGISGASNHGLSLCRAPFVARLDSDDIMEPERLERQLAFLSRRPELGGVGSAYSIIDETGRILGAETPHLLTIEDVELQLRSGGRLIYAHPTLMFRREVVLALGGYDSRFNGSEDVELTMRMHQAGRPIVVQPERLTRFRVHSASASANQGRHQFFCNAAIFGNFRRGLAGDERLPPDAYREALTRNPIQRLITEAKIRSYALRRRAALLKLNGRPCQATAVGAAAALLNPGAVAGVLYRAAVRWRRKVMDSGPYARKAASPDPPAAPAARSLAE